MILNNHGKLRVARFGLSPRHGGRFSRNFESLIRYGGIPSGREKHFARITRLRAPPGHGGTRSVHSSHYFPPAGIP